MELEDAAGLALELMHEHLAGQGWSLKFDNAKRRGGGCIHRRRIITLSRQLTLLNDEPIVRNTILHEIAHAIVGAGHGHDATWRATARSIGCDGKRCMVDEAASVPPKYVGKCAAGHEYPRHRRARGARFCTLCSPKGYDPAALITWHLAT